MRFQKGKSPVTATTAPKIQAEKIILNLATGLNARFSGQVVCDGPNPWEESRRQLQAWAVDAHPVGVEKIDFQIVYGDGTNPDDDFTYSGTYELMDLARDRNPSIGTHLREMALFHSGSMNPYWLEEGEYERYIEQLIPAETREMYLDLLNRYEMG